MGTRFRKAGRKNSTTEYCHCLKLISPSHPSHEVFRAVAQPLTLSFLCCCDSHLFYRFGRLILREPSPSVGVAQVSNTSPRGEGTTEKIQAAGPNLHRSALLVEDLQYCLKPTEIKFETAWKYSTLCTRYCIYCCSQQCLSTVSETESWILDQIS